MRQIGILVTSNDRSAFAARHPDDGAKVQTLMAAIEPHLSLVPYAVTDDEFPEHPDACAGYIITGSPASVSDPLPWIARLFEFIRALHERRIPTVGLCFGHQAIAVALGGRVEASPGGWRLGIAPTLVSAPAPWMVPGQAHVRLCAAHREQVSQLPPGAEVVGGDESCPIGAFRIGEHFFTTEYHPEFSREFMGALIDEMQDRVPASVTTEARASLAGRLDSALFGTWMARFLDRR